MTEPESKPASPATAHQGVQLGIGTLIIIAIIVSMCSGKGEMEQIQRDTTELKKQVGELNRKLDTLIEKDAQAAATPNVEAPASAEPAPNP